MFHQVEGLYVDKNVTVRDLKALLAQAKTPDGKKALVASTLALTDAEAKKFWPVYDAHQRKLEANNRRYSRAVEDVVMTNKPISDAYAKNLAKELTEIEDARPPMSAAMGVSALVFTMLFAAIYPAV